MIEIAAGILLAVLVLVFWGSIVRAGIWLVIVLFVFAALALFTWAIASLPTSALFFFLGFIYLGGIGFAVVKIREKLSQAKRPRELGAAGLVAQSEGGQLIWLGDGQRIVTKAFGPFARGQTIAHWQADYTRVFVGDLSFSPREVKENSRAV